VQSIFQSQLHFNSCFHHNYSFSNELRVAPNLVHLSLLKLSTLIRIPSEIVDVFCAPILRELSTTRPYASTKLRTNSYSASGTDHIQRKGRPVSQGAL